MVKLYSLKTNEYVNILRFRTEVYSILASKRLLVVALRDHLYGFDAVTMEKQFSLDCYSSMGATPGVVALGSRWIAYPGNIPLPSNRVQSASDKFVEVARDVAKDIASGLYYLGQKTFSEYMSYPTEDSPPNSSGTPSAQLSRSPEGPDHSETAGTVIVYDVCTQRNVAHFQAHAQPLSALAFDPSGSMLVTASIDGHNFNVFRVCPNSGGGIYNNYKHIYKLQRGLTNATIRHVGFSGDSRWVAVSSTRGTTHIYAINPTGGPVSIHTHLRSSPIHRTALLPLLNDQASSLVTLASFNRIKQSLLVEEVLRVPPIASTCAFVGHPFATEKMYIITQFGILTQYQLKPHAPPPNTDLDPTMLQLDIEAIVEWDVCRRTKWPELLVALSSVKEVSEPKAKEGKGKEGKGKEQVKSPDMNDVRWLSSVEISTHTPHLRPLWASPQFAFKVFQPQQKLPSPLSSLIEQQNNSNNNSNNNSLQSSAEKSPYLFYEHTPTKKVEVKHTDPMPFREKVDKSDHVYASEIYSESMSAPLAPPISEDVLKENISKAMSTPMNLQSLSKPLNSILDDYEGEHDIFEMDMEKETKVLSPKESHKPNLPMLHQDKLPPLEKSPRIEVKSKWQDPEPGMELLKPVMEAPQPVPVVVAPLPEIKSTSSTKNQSKAKSSKTKSKTKKKTTPVEESGGGLLANKDKKMPFDDSFFASNNRLADSELSPKNHTLLAQLASNSGSEKEEE